MIAQAAELGFADERRAGGASSSCSSASNGVPTTETHDAGGYFDLTPVDQGEDVRREIVLALEAMGFEVEAAHHEVAPGQHEIDFRYADALTTADNIATFRFVVKHVAMTNGLHATFMPKPIFGHQRHGHAHAPVALLGRGERASTIPRARGSSARRACTTSAACCSTRKGFCAITNPLVNSYKRLVPGYEAPINVAWSMRNRSPARPRARRRAAWAPASSCGCPTRRATRTSRSR